MAGLNHYSSFSTGTEYYRAEDATLWDLMCTCSIFSEQPGGKDCRDMVNMTIPVLEDRGSNELEFFKDYSGVRRSVVDERTMFDKFRIGTRDVPRFIAWTLNLGQIESNSN